MAGFWLCVLIWCGLVGFGGVLFDLVGFGIKKTSFGGWLVKNNCK